MNPEHNSKENENPTDEIDLNTSDSIDDFIKELEAKERDLHISAAEAVVEIEELDAGQDASKELEKLFEILQNTVPVETSSFTNSGNNYFPNHQAISGLEKEVLELRNEVSKLSNERGEMNELLRRRQGDFDNFRKRVERERSEMFRNLLCNVATKMLPVVDNMSRALDLTDNRNSEESNDFQQFIDGIRLVNHQLEEVLEGMGIQPILSVGQPFNPHYHEAVAIEQTSEVPPNTVMTELLRGYYIDDKVIRHAMVKVSAPSVSEENSEEVTIDDFFRELETE